MEGLVRVRDALVTMDEEIAAAAVAAPTVRAPGSLEPLSSTEPRWPFTDRRAHPREREWPERAMNVVIAAALLVVLAPVMLLVALAVRLTSAGEVIYAQERVGRNHRRGRERRRTHFGDRTDRRAMDSTGRIFTIYKFRTMRADAEATSGAVWASKNDSRVTPVGAFLRVSRLDELPQLWNVLRGDMNIVGPRPERAAIIINLVRDIREYPARHRTRPGITGWAQIQASYDTSLDDVRRKVRYDLEYLERRSLWLDLKIMVQTVPVMVFRKMGW
ncbi:MAG: hypothetical protein NVS4B3_05010 [Gemmatimonadaceae bacterium]